MYWRSQIRRNGGEIGRGIPTMELDKASDSGEDPLYSGYKVEKKVIIPLLYVPLQGVTKSLVIIV